MENIIRWALLLRGDVCFHTAKILTLVQDEIGLEGIRNARPTTLDGWFVGHASGEVTVCDN